MMKCLLLFTLMNLFPLNYGARILVYIPTPSISHQTVYRPLWRELSLRGHHVTLLTTDPINDPNLPNLTEIDLSSSYEVWNKYVLDIVNSGDSAFKTFQIFLNLFFDLIDNQMRHPSVKELINSYTKKFDLVIAESLVAPPSAFSKKFNCPLIGVASAPAMEHFYSAMGVPTHPILHPEAMLALRKPKTFSERIIATTSFVFTQLLVILYMEKVQNQLIDRYFGKGFGSVSEIVYNASMLFVNGNPILDGPRAMSPRVVYVGGIHKPSPKPLPDALRVILDSANQGFIYFSLGTNVKSKDISLKTRQMILDTFSELPYKVLWKFELDYLDNKPDNVFITKWFPQFDVLNHPNVKLFITHGGVLSMEEAIYARVPMIAMPFFGDQAANVDKMVRKGIALYFSCATLEKQHFKNAVLEVIQNQSYRTAVNELADLMEDQPMTSLERAIWWTEYVIRHKGAPHLKDRLTDISWCQYLLLDVIANLILILAIFIILVVFLMGCAKKIVTMKHKQK